MSLILNTNSKNSYIHKTLGYLSIPDHNGMNDWKVIFID